MVAISTYQAKGDEPITAGGKPGMNSTDALVADLRGPVEADGTTPSALITRNGGQDEHWSQ